jgi:hypothetical protein
VLPVEKRGSDFQSQTAAGFRVSISHLLFSCSPWAAQRLLCEDAVFE